jgi:hypothetical protein
VGARPHERLLGGHRGTGVFVTGGDFRIRNLSITLGPDGVETPRPVTVELRTDTFGHWLAVAHDAVSRSQVARELGIEAGPDDAFLAAIESEFRASLIGVSAAAFALDAFYASVIHKAPETRIKARRRAATLSETFKRAFALTHANAAAMHQPMRDVFRFRRQAVHPPEEFEPPVAHPVFGVGMERRFVIFRTENALLATTFAHRLIWLCLHRPKPRWTELVAWTEGAKRLVEEPQD